MKTLLLSTLTLFFLLPIVAQEQLAFNKTKAPILESVKKTPIKNEVSKNALFLKSFSNKKLPKTVAKVNQLIADFELSTLSNYSTVEPFEYDVTFDENNHKVQATYAHNGDLVNYTGQFKNVRLPFELSREVSKSYPGWYVKSSKCLINYDNNEQSIIYKLTLEKDGQTKKIKIS